MTFDVFSRVLFLSLAKRWGAIALEKPELAIERMRKLLVQQYLDVFSMMSLMSMTDRSRQPLPER
jgi:hypothetical protein